MKIILERFNSAKYYTQGKIDVVNGIVSVYQCYSLELPWKDNKKEISCIPDGEYPVTVYQSPNKGEVLLLHDVPGRSMIEIHIGNYATKHGDVGDILGCILPGTSYSDINGDGILDITNSAKAMSEIMRYKHDITKIVINTI